MGCRRPPSVRSHGVVEQHEDSDAAGRRSEEDPFDGSAPFEHDDLTPPMRRTRGPDPRVLRNREEQAARDEYDQRRWEKSIEAHIAAHRVALDFLEETHQRIADTHDFDLIGDSRPAAMWQMTGRCIGIARLICDALALGYTAEVMHLARALHEADRLADIFALPEGTDLVRKWLADEGNEWVRPGEVRAAESRFEDRLAQAMRDFGVPELQRAREATRTLYGHQSQAAHHRRKWTQDAVAPQLRTMFRGPTTVWSRRAVTTAAMLGVVEEAVLSVGDTLAAFMPSSWYGQHITPFVATFEAHRATQPLR